MARAMWTVQMDIELLCAFITVICLTVLISAFRRARPKFDPKCNSSTTKAVCSSATTPGVAPGERIAGVDQKREATDTPAFERTQSALSSADTPKARRRRLHSESLHSLRRLRPAEGGVPDSGSTTARARPSSSDPSTSRAKVLKASQPSLREKVTEWLSNAEWRTGGSSTRLSRILSDGSNQVGPATLKMDAGSQARVPGVSSAGKRRTKNSSDRPGSSPAARPSEKARNTKPNAPATAPARLGPVLRSAKVDLGAEQNEDEDDGHADHFSCTRQAGKEPQLLCFLDLDEDPGLPFGPLRRPASLSRPVTLPRSRSFERMISNDREVPMTPLPAPLSQRRNRSESQIVGSLRALGGRV